ncbi:hypothetical protein D9615_003394 [Tricholomella constricta]|uniref:F-box domain-containing protein n=1 Tax=Tricholomella constricta TaxID=117010 RepID=A0A8H5HJH3_9AGAR|nr:hypothetical protein D9615_003394 [Tricholomella constricta]
MVSADNLNLDVLGLIFAHLTGKDLAAVALVSKPFLAGVIPRLYRTLSFRIHNAKRYPSVRTSFSTILDHPDLATHVRNIDIRATPLLHSRVDPDFIRECTRALELCDNLRSFVYTPTAVTAILPLLPGRERLRELRINARFTTAQAATLAKIGRLEKLELDRGSWEVIDVLPVWTAAIQHTLKTLTLFMSAELNFQVLETALSHLPRLLELHIIACPNIDHLKVMKLVAHTPLLESLAFTVTETVQAPEPLLPPPSLSNLRHLALDARAGLTANPSSSATLLSILTSINWSFPSLTSAALKIPDVKAEASHELILKLLTNHALTLQRLVFVDTIVEVRSIAEICERCRRLEVLSLPLPMKEILSFSDSLALSPSLRTLIDGDAHVTHGPRPYLNHENAQYIMLHARALTRIISDKRIWTGRRDDHGRVRVGLERQAAGPSAHWFMPPG